MDREIVVLVIATAARVASALCKIEEIALADHSTTADSNNAARTTREISPRTKKTQARRIR
ncbi:hypothetical protein P0O24_11825 [Methanotrichaceae archaeon M04Ac]|uniref:Secreted protein n=1 Tax=Candidatus Methanocrinis alkalitolerans TaxID=3033395 RepID=A0ABT5XIE4_9EURY|nr:hypothetical protein [Candidatus Methanocrinis alkalitolerans]MDF0594267.1 hypothetical protein [Candidatus Methanocrinis alkalitolerans]